MKTKITFLLLLTILMVSCTKYQDFYGSANGDDKSKKDDESKKEEYSKTQVIVRFAAGLEDWQKKEIRDKHEIVNIETCSCGDPNLELWGFDPDKTSVEFEVEKLRGRPRAEGDLLFNFSIEPIEGFEPKAFPGSLDPKLILSESNKADVNIAVIDSGVDYAIPFVNNSSSTPYLFKTQNLIDCPSPTGWNFTDEGAQNDILDLNGHGSMVTKIITSKLDESNSSYSILPIKAFNSAGEGSYWNVVCAFGYIQEIQAKGAKINIVNASFGKAIEKELFYEENLLNTMIDELGTSGVLVVTSAGNDGLDTDFGAKKHFPSGFVANSILSVGGYASSNNNETNIHGESNFGKISIDVAAPFDGWTPRIFNRIYPIEGTSFSTAYVTGLVARSFIEKGRPEPIQLKTDFLNNTYGTMLYSDALRSFINNGAYVKRE